MSPDEIATMLDALAEEITRQVALRAGMGTRPAINGDQAVTAIVMALTVVAERVSQQ